MYDLTKGFRLHSTLAPASTTLSWTLSRHVPTKQLPLILGRVDIPTPSNNQQKLAKKIAQQLNSRSCFAFAYVPQENDFLRLTVQLFPPLWLAFRFQQQQWQVDASSYFDNWRRQLEVLEQGAVVTVPRVRTLFD